MLTGASIVTLLCGGGIAATAPHLPSKSAMLEWLGGLLLCVGLALVGSGLPWILT